MVFVFSPNEHISFSFYIWFFFLILFEIDPEKHGIQIMLATKYFNLNSKNMEVFFWKSFPKFNNCRFSN